MASTPIDPTVEQAMLHALKEHTSNPHALHQGGIEALSAIDRAAGQIADAINADASEITFTSGASEANNAALKGIAFAAAGRGRHLIVSALEHACVLEAANWLSENGFEVTVVPASPAGLIDPSDVFQALRDDTILVSVQLANNEVGTVQPVAEIAARCRQRGIIVHSDAAQAFG
ncbi:MAG: aminotransferase class V-fold PLP-dependent enzyme, partial [Pseudomonadota bacterium]